MTHRAPAPTSSWQKSMKLRLALLLALPLLLPGSARGDGAYLVRDIDLTREPYSPTCDIVCPPPPVFYGSLVSDLTPLGDRVLFVATDHVHGFALWISDGTADGTLTLAHPPATDLQTILLGAAGGYGLFWSWNGGDLWVTDGTPGGTEPLPMPCQLGCDAWDGRAWSLEGAIFFNAYDRGAARVKLYRFDPGARAVEEVFNGCADSQQSFCLSSVVEMVSWNGTIHFSVVQGTNTRLYRMDPSGANPSLVPAACQRSTDLLPFGSQFLFVGNCGGPAGKRSLFALDHPDAPPRLVRDFADARRLIAWGGDRAAFTDGSALWTTDGTTGGTVAAGFEHATALVPMGDDLLVAGFRGGVAGLYALQGSGTVATLHVGQVEVGPGVAGGGAFFAADTPGLGVELWVTDGTPQGTRLYQDLAPGPASSRPGDGGPEPTGFVTAGDRVYFAASDPQHDIELWAAPLGDLPPPSGCQPSADALCIGGRFVVEIEWTDFDGNSGRGTAVPLAAATGAFWFFDASNLEVTVKVLDGRGVNGHHWVFFGALSNVEFTLTVTDTATGLKWTHHNPSGRFASGADTAAFPE